MVDIESTSADLERRILAAENQGKKGELHRLRTEWCELRDSLEGEDRERCIQAAVAVKIDFSKEALDLLKDRNPLAHEVYIKVKAGK